MFLYYITDRRQLGKSEAERRARLLQKIQAAAEAGVDAIQLREKDLSTRELEGLARETAAIIKKFPRTKLLVNSRSDVALATGADGVHLRSDDVSVPAAKRVWQMAAEKEREAPTIAVSCHTQEDVARAADEGADFAVFAPVIEKDSQAGIGLEALKRACGAAGAMPVLALGGVTLANAAECLRAGAAGVAGIRLFQEGDVRKTIQRLRALRTEHSRV